MDSFEQMCSNASGEKMGFFMGEKGDENGNAAYLDVGRRSRADFCDVTWRLSARRFYDGGDY